MFLSDDKIRPVRDLRRTGQWQTMCPTARISLVIGLVTHSQLKSETFGFGSQLEPGCAQRACMVGSLPRPPHIDQTDCESLLST